jgi:exopolysaccharide biosynthesis polyprenyl glycosylphosphotransferase
MASILIDKARTPSAPERGASEARFYIPEGPQRGLQAVGKRVLDIVVAGLCLIVLSPFAIAIAIAIVIESGWPSIFAQERMGLRGQTFIVFKFRSMYKDAEQRLASLLDANEIKDGPIFKLRHDPRVTVVGRFLRKTSLDELPQLWNVLRGDMSLVGPRPPLASEVAQYEPWQLVRLAVKPGMTGLWQVSGRSNLGFIEMVQLDIAYVENWSLVSDITLLLRTAPAVLTARGAY